MDCTRQLSLKKNGPLLEAIEQDLKLLYEITTPLSSPHMEGFVASTRPRHHDCVTYLLYYKIWIRR
jgi:hypothetical protein